MNQNKLREQFKKYCLKPMLAEQKEMLAMFSNFFSLAIANHHREGLTNERIGHAKLLLQMMLSKTLHLSSLVNGVGFFNNASPEANNLIDPTIIAISVRNIYETAGAFNLIYRQPKSEDENKIMHSLWMIAGLKYRQRFESHIRSESIRGKQVNELQQIQELISEIEQTDFYRGLPERSKDKIQNRIDRKEYLMHFVGNDVHFLAWHELIKVMGIKENIFDHMYTYFSFYTHPSSISVIQFGQMFEETEKANLNLTNFNLMWAIFILSIFAADYITVFPSVLKTFESFSLLEQILMNHHNLFARGNDYSINSSWQALDDLAAYLKTKM